MMKVCKKCGELLRDGALSCPHCGASQSLDVRLSVAAMKFLGIVCGSFGVALFVYADRINAVWIKPDAHPYIEWVLAGVLIVIGFVYFYRKWPERE